jgi:hydroxymethylglutaryl-CoA reductase (NADPH)
LTLHILNLITPLTPSRHNTSPSSLNAQVNIRKVDITAPALRSVLNALVDASAVDVSSHSTNDSDVDDAVVDVPGDIFVKVLPPVYMRAVPSPAMLALSASSSKLSSDHSFSGSAPFRLFRAIMPKHISERVEAFMTAWTRLVGDPILSKWITILLAISITLNGYLLKGIAAGVVGVRLGQFGVRGAVRFEDEGEVEEESVDVKTHEEAVAAPPPSTVAAAPASPQRPAFDVQPRIEPQSAPRVVVPAVATFTLEDVDKKLQIAKANSRRLTITAASMRPNNITPPLSMEGVRSLEECIDIFENGPRPLSASLALLNDEEVILLAQNGKIAAYALEKVLGMDELERAVRIRRALICKSYL